MDKPKVKLIINPNADMGNAWRHASALRPIVEERADVEWSGTVYPTHAVELAKKAGEDDFDIVIAVGGDGTVHEVVNGLMQIPAEKRPKLGVVPMGSGNDFAHAVGLSESPAKAMKDILTGKSKHVDIGMIADNHGRQEYWDNSLSIGFGGAVTIYSHSMPILRGFLMYFAAVVQTIIRSYEVMQLKVTTDQDSWDGEYMLFAVCNGPREGGGFLTAPTAIPDDGLLNFTGVKKISRAMMFRLIPEFMKGTHIKFKSVETGLIKKIEIDSKQPLFLHTDGEIFANFESEVYQLKIEIIPNALEVMIPNEK